MLGKVAMILAALMCANGSGRRLHTGRCRRARNPRDRLGESPSALAQPFLDKVAFATEGMMTSSSSRGRFSYAKKLPYA
ncbi:hypothetical protein PL963_P100084 (plasmid) [Pseudomonas cerasi]|uniref:Uncharacterized protein n=1 Tax=Pseudomonas cerasi TaxID=1583341 RepID=A0A2K4W2F5_9PSED|nr:hypothetical protein PL963_P100084 [Pseudomonas cerasi]